MDRLTPLADAFLEAEDVDPVASLAIGSVVVFAGPAPDFEEFLRTIEGRLPLIPRYRQRLRASFWGLGAPAWQDDPAFDVRRHVHRRVLPAPGGRAEIGHLLSEVMPRRMDRSRPLWDYWFVEGLPDGRWALLSKVHHAVVDGVSGTDLYQLVLDPTPEPRDPVADTWVPSPPTDTWSEASDALRTMIFSPLAAGRLALAGPRRATRTAATAAQGALRLSGALRPVSATSLTGRLDGRRRYTWTEAGMDDVRAVRRAFSVSVNDVALAAVTGGFRRLLLSRGEEPVPRAIRSLVPVSTRAAGEESILDNRVSLLLPYLPVDIEDPVARLAEVRRRILSLRAAHEPEAGAAITALAAYEPFPWVVEAIRLGLRLPQTYITTVTTNVPGPRTTLYSLGREGLTILPYVPIADRVRIGVAIYSYRDTLTFGITADHTVGDLEVLADGISDSLADLVAAAEVVG